MRETRDAFVIILCLFAIAWFIAYGKDVGLAARTLHELPQTIISLEKLR